MASIYRLVGEVTDPNIPHSFSLRMIGSNQRVLELGAAAGDMTRALAAQSCRVTAIEYDAANRADLEEVADEVIIADLNDPHVFDRIDGNFDVVLAGDVLEHLIDPETVLKSVVRLLAPGGRVVISLPNIAHVDVRLALLQGRFDYTTVGLLDKTHLRFFTRKSIDQLVTAAGLLIIEMHKVRHPAFHTELGVNRDAVSPHVLAEILADPDAQTYQFVFMAVRNDGNQHTAQLADKYTSLRENYDLALEHLGTTQAQLAAIQASKTLRYTAKPRAVYHRLEALLKSKRS